MELRQPSFIGTTVDADLPMHKLLFLTALIFSIAMSGCDRSSANLEQEQEANSAPVFAFSSTDEKATGHDRMRSQLTRLVRAKLHDRLRHGTLDVQLHQRQYRELPSDAPEQRRFELAYRLGDRLLWQGDTREAIEFFHEAHNLVKESEDRGAGSMWEKATFGLGLAYLRLGENENCVKCCNGQSCILPIRDKGIHKNREGSEAAVGYFEQVLASNPEHIEARWLLIIASMTLGVYPDAVAEEFRVDPELFESQIDFPKFTNIATFHGVDTVDLSGGSIADDFDGDGDLDLISSSNWFEDQIMYYRNEGGTFVDATEESGLLGITGGLNLVQADYDNDGDIDFFALRGAWLEEHGDVIPNSLLQNDGNGHFTDVTYESGLGNQHFATQTAAWADYDNDGDLDLYVGNERKPNNLFQNDGTGHFTDVAVAAGVTNGLFSKSVVFGDYNEDGFPDLYVSNQGQDNRMYRNNRDGTFTDVAKQLGVLGDSLSFPAWFWDYNQDGHLDLLVTGYCYGLSYVDEHYFGHIQEDAPRNVLYQGDGSGGFVDVSKEQNVDDVSQTMGSNFGDLDNDGYPDFYLGTGEPAYQGLMPNVMYWNRRGKGFSNVTTEGGFGHLQKGHGVAFADFDNDGDQDVYIQMGGAFPGDNAANCLYQNPGFGNHYLTVHLVGVTSNRSAIGARIKLDIVEDGTPRSVYKWVNTGGTFGGNPLRQHIGVGAAELVQRAEIHWPTTGKTQVFEKIAVDQTIRIVEDEDQFSVVEIDVPKSMATLPSPEQLESKDRQPTGS